MGEPIASFQETAVAHGWQVRADWGGLIGQPHLTLDMRQARIQRETIVLYVTYIADLPSSHQHALNLADEMFMQARHPARRIP